MKEVCDDDDDEGKRGYGGGIYDDDEDSEDEEFPSPSPHTTLTDSFYTKTAHHRRNQTRKDKNTRECNLWLVMLCTILLLVFTSWLEMQNHQQQHGTRKMSGAVYGRAAEGFEEYVEHLSGGVVGWVD